jgi:hypothetical protein
VYFRFPGNSSFATEVRGKDPLERWLQRFVSLGPQIYPDKGDDERPALALDDLRAWHRRPRQRGRTRLRQPLRHMGPHGLGLVREYEVYEDTQKSAAFDGYLADRERSSGSSRVNGRFVDWADPVPFGKRGSATQPARAR